MAYGLWLMECLHLGPSAGTSLTRNGGSRKSVVAAHGLPTIWQIPEVVREGYHYQLLR